MNIKFVMILETLSISFGMVKGILKEHKSVHMRVKVIQALLLRIRRTTPNKESLGKE